MKHKFFTALFFAILFVSHIEATTFKADDLYYNVLTEGGVEISGTVEVIRPTDYSDYQTDIIIPDQVSHDGVTYLVTAIGRDAFSGSTKMKKCTIGSNVAEIKRRAFTGTGLTSLIVPANVKTIEEEAFYGNGDLVEINVNSGYVGKHAFENNYNLKSITFGPEIKVIREGAFDGCNYIEQLHIPSFDIWNSVSIGSSDWGIFGYVTYSDLKKPLIDLYISGVKIENIVIPDNVISLSPFIFESCNIKSVVLPAGLESIGTRAFSRCSNLKSIKLSQSLKETGAYAFFECSSLEDINFSGNISHIGEGSFSNCTSLRGIEIPESVTSMGMSVFSGCTSLTSVRIGEGLNTIPAYCFIGCSNIQDMTIPDNIQTIGVAAFSSCYRLGRVSLGKYVKEILSGAFENCTSLQEIKSYNPEPPAVHVKQNSWATDESSFSGVDMNFCVVYVPAESIEAYKDAKGWDAFANIRTDKDNLTKFAYEGLYYQILNATECEVTYGYPAPSGEIAVPASVAYGDKTYSVVGVSDYAFYENKDISKITINEGIRYVGDYAFSYEPALAFISFPSTIERIGDFALIGCTSLSVVESKNPTPPSLEGNYVTFDNETLQNADLYIPPTLQYKDSNNEWRRFSHINYTDFKGGVYFEATGLTERAFYRLTGDDSCELSKVISCNSSFYVGYQTIYYKDKTYSVTSVAENAFHDIPDLNFIELYPSVKQIAANSIGDNCDNILSVKCHASTPPALDGGIYRNPENATRAYLLVPEGCEEVYKNDNNWVASGVIATSVPHITEDMLIYSAYPGNRAAVSANRDYNSASYEMPEYVMPEEVIIDGNICKVTQILGYAFMNAKGFKSLTLPRSLEVIGSWAFYWCEEIPVLKVCAPVPPVFTGDPNISEYIYEATPLYVPAESVEAYKGSPYWGDFSNILPMDDSNGIDDIESDNILFSSHDRLVFAGDVSARIYDISGKLIIEGKGTLRLPGSGIYLIIPEGGNPVKIRVN